MTSQWVKPQLFYLFWFYVLLFPLSCFLYSELLSAVNFMQNNWWCIKEWQADNSVSWGGHKRPICVWNWSSLPSAFPDPAHYLSVKQATDYCKGHGLLRRKGIAAESIMQHQSSPALCPLAPLLSFTWEQSLPTCLETIKLTGGWIVEWGVWGGNKFSVRHLSVRSRELK